MGTFELDTWFLITNLVDTIPDYDVQTDCIIEAARIDGLSEIRIFFQMFIPTMRSTYAAAMTITFMNAWNSYLWPKVIMTTSESITMPMVVANIVQGYVTDYGMLMCAVLICTLPTAIVFFVLQKSFAEGITGAVKELDSVKNPGLCPG